MGDFAGHMANGSMLFLVGLFWLYNVLYRHFLCQREAAILQKDNPRPFRTEMIFPIRCYPRVPVIPMAICIIIGVTMILEIIVNNSVMNTMEHCTMFFSFFIVAAFMILVHSHPHILPDGEYYLLLVCLIMNMVLMLAHNHGPGSTHLQMQLHYFMFFNWILTFVVVVAEIINRNNIAIAVLKPLMFLFQGIWIDMIAFVLYVPATAWTPNHESVTMANISYTWVMVAILCLFAFVYFVANKQVARLENYAVTLALDIEYGKTALKYETLKVCIT